MVNIYLEVFVIVEDPPVEAIDPGVGGVGRVVDHSRAARPPPVGDVVDGGGPHGHHWAPDVTLFTVRCLHSDDAGPVLFLSPSPHYHRGRVTWDLCADNECKSNLCSKALK